MLLSTDTRHLEVLLAAPKTTKDCPWFAMIIDTIREQEHVDRYLGFTNGVTEVEVVPAPPGNTAREITELMVYNDDSANVTVIIRYDDGVTQHIVKKTTLTPGQTLTYQRYNGWQVN